MLVNSQLEGISSLFFQDLISCSLWYVSVVLQVLWSCYKPLSTHLFLVASRHLEYVGPISNPRQAKQNPVSWAAPWKAKMLEKCPTFLFPPGRRGSQAVLATVCCIVCLLEIQQAAQLSFVLDYAYYHAFTKKARMMNTFFNYFPSQGKGKSWEFSPTYFMLSQGEKLWRMCASPNLYLCSQWSLTWWSFHSVLRFMQDEPVPQTASWIVCTLDICFSLLSLVKSW